MKFKVGDRVNLRNGEAFGTVVSDAEFEKKYSFNPFKGSIPVLYDRGTFNGIYQSLEYTIRKEITMENAKWGIKYDRDTDPVEFFKTKKKAQDRISELLDDNGVVKSSIYLFEVGKVFKVERPIAYKLVIV